MVFLCCNLFSDVQNSSDRAVVLEDGMRIESTHSLYNPKRFLRSLQCYFCLILIQYILAYMSVPFENIENRPPIVVFSVVLTIIIVSIIRIDIH